MITEQETGEESTYYPYESGIRKIGFLRTPIGRYSQINESMPSQIEPLPCQLEILAKTAKTE